MKTKKLQKYKYNAWKTLSNGDPIEGTDRIFRAESKRNVMKALAFEEGVTQPHGSLIVRCNDGTMWCASKF